MMNIRSFLISSNVKLFEGKIEIQVALFMEWVIFYMDKANFC